MTAISTSTVVNLFKKVYGGVSDLLPEDYPLQQDIPFSSKQKVGESYNEAVALTNETGWTLGGSGMDAFDINSAVAGAVKQATVNSYATILASVVPFGVLARSAGGGEKAFADGTKHVVKSNLKSHGKLTEMMRWYGQSSELMGYVSYATATYRNVAFTTGTGTLSINGTNVTFTTGVNTTSKWILFAPGSFCSGVWVGSEGATVQQVSSSAVVGEGTLMEVDAEKGAIRVDFTPVVATTATSHRICFKGQLDTKEQIGIHNILSTSGTLFGISNTTYSIWKGTVYGCSNQKFTMQKFQDGIASAVNRGALDGDITVYVNPRTWSTLIQTEAGGRAYDDSYKAKEAENGMEHLVWHSQAGKATVRACRFVKEGHAFGLHLPDWSRSGAAEISFTVPGVDKEIIFPLENTAAMAFRSYSDQYLFCNAPARSILWNSINDESTT